MMFDLPKISHLNVLSMEKQFERAFDIKSIFLHDLTFSS